MKLLTLTFMAFLLLLILVITSHMVARGMAITRARECSEMLHGYAEGTLVPLTKDASVEIGACLLQFNQPIGDD